MTNDLKSLCFYVAYMRNMLYDEIKVVELKALLSAVTMKQKGGVGYA